MNNMVKVGKHHIKVGTRLRFSRIEDSNSWKICIGDIFVITKITPERIYLINQNSKRGAPYSGETSTELDHLWKIFDLAGEQYEFDF